jgi:hypothetical protein
MPSLNAPGVRIR